MADAYDKLKKSFDIPNQVKDNNIQSEDVEVQIVKEEEEDVSIVKSESSDADTDYQHVRKHLKSLMRRSSETLEEILDLASESGSPRAYEVAGQILKNSSEISEKLIQLHKNNKELNDVNSNVNVTNNNAIFFGSTSELLKTLKSQNIIEDNK
jgi:multidrug efflux pump subunit AcrB